MDRVIEVMKEAIKIAKGVMDYCSGDAWEREVTESDRNRFDEIYYEIFPEDKEKEPEEENRYCEICDRIFSHSLGLEMHIKYSVKHKMKVEQTTGNSKCNITIKLAKDEK